MQDLKVIGIEDGALIAVSDEGDRFRVEIDAVMQTKIRQLQSARAANTRVSPREIQAHIRSGMTREQVAAATGASVEDVERFERPVLAEREHVLSQALAAGVHVAGDDAQNHTFGTVIRERLGALGATNERWACWKDELQGWVVKVEFSANSIDHDARWAFDVRAQSLQPLGSEAMTLSQHGDIRGGLIPKLRAVDTGSITLDRSRFDSGAFVMDPAALSDGLIDDLEPLDVVPSPPEHSLPTATAAATNREDEPAHSPNDTADLLEALRKRRGERQATPAFDPFADIDGDQLTEHAEPIAELSFTATEPVAQSVASPWGGSANGEDTEDAPTVDIETAPVVEMSDSHKRKSGRTSLPSWDEIVFGSKSDAGEDPA